MSNTKLKVRFYTIADFNEEEAWLREEHKKGWKFIKLISPCFYLFGKCDPEDVIYRLDYKDSYETDDYIQMVQDYGWEYAGKCLGWLFFRKPASKVTAENDGKIFSDNVSRVNMLQHIMKTHMPPILIIFLCCVLPNVSRIFDQNVSNLFAAFWGVIFVIYVFLLMYCGIKLRKLKKDLDN